MTRSLRVSLIGALALASINCGGGGTENNDPTPGALSVVFASPSPGDGAVILTITSAGVAPTSFTAGAGLQLFASGAPSTTSRVVLTGALNTGSTILTMAVPDTRDDEDYTVTVDQVSSTTYTIRALTGYTATVEK